MYMTPLKLIGLRILMTTLGRWGWFAERFKRSMVKFTILKRGKAKYVASSRFFSWDQLEDKSSK